MSYGVVGGLAAPPLNVNANSSLSSCVCFWVVSPFSFYVFLSLSNDNDSDVVAADFCNFQQSLSDGGGGSGGGGGGGGDSIHLGNTSASGYKWRLVIAYEGTRYSGWVFTLALDFFTFSLK